MACDIQVVNPSVLSRIESFMNDSSYREAIENSANYNTRLCIERRLRLPFLDSQTGVAQNHSNLFMSPRERIPGLEHGQLYSYPSKRWRKKRRQYLMQPQVALRRLEGCGPGQGGDSSDLHVISTLENPAAASNEDSKDSSSARDDSKLSDQWYYDELELQAMDGFDDVDPDSDYDYEETYKKKKKRGGPGKPGKAAADSPHGKKGPKGTGQGRGRRKGMIYSEIADSDKPFSCDLCGARYKTRPGLTYHYTHSHKEGSSATPTPSSRGGGGRSGGSGGGGGGSGTGVGDGGSSSSSSTPAPPPLHDDESCGGGGPLALSSTLPCPSPSPQPQPPAQSPAPPVAPAPSDSHHHQQPVTGWTKFQDSYLTFLNAPGRRGRSGVSHGSPGVAHLSDDSQQSGPPLPQPPVAVPVHQGPSDGKKLSATMQEQVLIMEQNEKERAPPSAYCDFCLGDAVSNKKSGQPEELLSCADCGRSGHPTCLQFTDNMIISVRKYRWQCIECKCCSICGTSDNDDQLLFCDDCDRGYHMYCLAPPLHTPPEGSWSCRLCLIQFHDK